MEKLKLNRSKDYDRNLETFGDDGSNCFICGRKTNEKHFIHYTTDGDLVPYNAEVENSQGVFPIGPMCKNKLPKEFIG
tara:strand:+ start:276 stop:509 length:234 start_codon:yes stop_codon:yes gene_type:complete